MFRNTLGGIEKNGLEDLQKSKVYLDWLIEEMGEY
jgi:hypothetical protein